MLFEAKEEGPNTSAGTCSGWPRGAIGRRLGVSTTRLEKSRGHHEGVYSRRARKE